LIEPEPSSATQSVEVVFSVIGGGVTPTGIVSISGADINCQITLSGGTGSCNVVFNTIGVDKPITATYSGDSNYLGSVGTAVHTVVNASTTTITSITPDFSYPGDAVQVCVTLSGAGAAPSGNVTLTGADGGPYTFAVAGSGCLGGVLFNSAGAKVITATFEGQAGVYSGSSGSLGHTVNKGTPTVTISDITPGGAVPNQNVVVTVEVTGAGVPPTGTVAISISGVPAQVQTCTLTLSILPAPPPHGSCTIYFTAAGSFTINAVYSGDQNYTGGTDSAAPYIVT
jgi:large repetitive protein